jgi:hypothetical protein
MVIIRKHIFETGFCGQPMIVSLTRNFFYWWSLVPSEWGLSVVRTIDTGRLLIQDRLLKYPFTITRLVCGVPWIVGPYFFNRAVLSVTSLTFFWALGKKKGHMVIVC